MSSKDIKILVIDDEPMHINHSFLLASHSRSTIEILKAYPSARTELLQLVPELKDDIKKKFLDFIKLKNISQDIISTLNPFWQTL